MEQFLVNLIYIDPGTGSMLFTIFIGAVSVLFYSLKSLKVKLSSGIFKGNKESKENHPLVIYSDDKRYWTTFKPICDELEKLEQETVYLSQSEDDPAFNSDYKYIKCEFIGEGNKGFTKLNFLSADVLLSTTPSLDVYQWKRSKNVKHYVHVLHMPNDVTTYRMFGLDYYDSIILSGPFQADQIRRLEELRNIKKKELKVLGLPYLDTLMKKRKGSQKKDDHETTILVAPSWGDTALLKRYGSSLIENLLATGYKVIVRPHPQSFASEKEMMDELMKKYPSSERLEWNRDNDNFSCLEKADLMISDFSGVIFDFALVFERPIIYADVSFDKSVYDAWWLDEELWTFKVLPRIGRQLSKDNLGSLKNLIDECLADKSFKEEIRKVKDECWANPGHSAEKIGEYLVNTVRQLQEERS